MRKVSSTLDALILPAGHVGRRAPFVATATPPGECPRNLEMARHEINNLEKTKRKRHAKRATTIDKIVDAVFDLINLDAPRPVILQCGDIAEEAFGLGWSNAKAYREIRPFESEVMEDLRSLTADTDNLDQGIHLVPLNERAIKRSEFAVTRSDCDVKDWKAQGFVSYNLLKWKARLPRVLGRHRDKEDPDKVKMGYLRDFTPDTLRATSWMDKRDINTRLKELGVVNPHKMDRPRMRDELTSEQMADVTDDFPIGWSQYEEILQQCLPRPNFPTVAYAVHIPGCESLLQLAYIGVRGSDVCKRAENTHAMIKDSGDRNLIPDKSADRILEPLKRLEV